MADDSKCANADQHRNYKRSACFNMMAMQRRNRCCRTRQRGAERTCKRGIEPLRRTWQHRPRTHANGCPQDTLRTIHMVHGTRSQVATRYFCRLRVQPTNNRRGAASGWTNTCPSASCTPAYDRSAAQTRTSTRIPSNFAAPVRQLPKPPHHARTKCRRKTTGQ